MSGNDTADGGEQDSTDGLCIELDESERSDLSEYAEHHNLSAAEAARQFVTSGLADADVLKTRFDKIREFDGPVKVKVSCDCCGYSETFRRVDRVEKHDPRDSHPRDSMDDCSSDDVSIDAYCPQHGKLPIRWGYCDSCRADQHSMVSGR